MGANVEVVPNRCDLAKLSENGGGLGLSSALAEERKGRIIRYHTQYKMPRKR